MPMDMTASDAPAPEGTAPGGSRLNVREPVRMEMHPLAGTTGPAVPPPGDPAADAPVAVILFHGMGQQVPFEGLSAAAKLVERGSGVVGSGPKEVRFARIGSQWLPRAELTVQSEAGEVRVHVYEVYWAPLTEGAIHAWEVTRFLLLTGVSGLWTSLRGRPFTRWVFGREREFETAIRTALKLALVFVLVLLALLVYAAFLVSVAAFVPAVFDWMPQRVQDGLPSWWWWIPLAAALPILYLRRKYIQFIGDVVIYVSSHEVNRFDAIRATIRARAVDTAAAVYGALDHGALAYRRVVFAGHSLGSVIAYDTLNAMINRDAVGVGAGTPPLQVVRRTSTLLTFGSPLDKTAYLFRAQVRQDEVREAMASAVQPLICNSRVRTAPDGIRWVNLYAPRDYISGALDYYDPPAQPTVAGANPSFMPVENLRDPEARIPVLAHMQFWKGEALARELYRALI